MEESKVDNIEEDQAYITPIKKRMKKSMHLLPSQKRIMTQ